MNRSSFAAAVTYALAGSSPDALLEAAPQVEIALPQRAPEALLEGLPRVVGALNLRPAPAADAESGLRIDVGIDPSAPPQRPEANVRRLARDARGTAWTGAEGWVWTCPGYRVDCPFAGCTARLTLHPADPAVHPREGAGAVPWRRLLAYGVRQALVTLLPRTGWMPLHGAALQPPADGLPAGPDAPGALLLVGASGAGKSTLTAGLIQRGWTCISDDLLVLPPPEDGPVRVVSLTRGVRLLPDAWNRLGLSAMGEEGPSASAKASAKMSAKDPGARHGVFGAPGGRPKHVWGGEGEAPPVGAPRTLVVPSIADVPESRLRPMRGTEALGAVLHQMHPPLLLPDDAAAAQLHRAAALLRQTRPLHLTAGQDLYNEPGRLGEWVLRKV